MLKGKKSLLRLRINLKGLLFLGLLTLETPVSSTPPCNALMPPDPWLSFISKIVKGFQNMILFYPVKIFLFYFFLENYNLNKRYSEYLTVGNSSDTNCVNPRNLFRSVIAMYNYSFLNFKQPEIRSL